MYNKIKFSKFFISFKKVNELIKFINIEGKKKNIIKLVFFVFVCFLLDLISLGSIVPLIILVLQKDKALIFFNGFEIFSGLTYLNLIFGSLVMITLFATTKFLFLSYTQYYKNFFLGKIQNAFSSLLLSKYLNNSYDFFLKIKISNLIANTKIEVERVRAFCGTSLDFFLELFVLVTLLIIVFILNPSASALFLLFIFFSSYLFLSIIRKSTKKIGEKKSFYYKIVNNHLFHVFKDIKFIKLFNLYSHSIQYFNEVDIKEINQTAKFLTFSSLPRIYFEFIFIISTVTFVFFFIFIFDVSDIYLLANYISLYALVGFRVLPGISRIYSSYQQLKFYKNAVDIIYDDCFTKNKFANKENLIFKKLKKSVIYKINNLNFSFEKKPNKKILQISNLSVNKGDKIGIVGPSGSGKSTMIDIMLGLLSSSSGEIVVNKSLFFDKNYFYSKLGYVSQNVQLIDGSIKKNIFFGTSNYEKNKIQLNRRLIRVAKICNIYSFIKKTSAKFNSKIYEDGKNLSVGQRQRILIARALFKNPDILFMDEPTSALDSKNSISILKKILKLNNKTVVMVTHHKALLKYFNKVFEINNGLIKKIK